MKIKVIEQSFSLLEVSNQMFHAIDRRLSIITDEIVSIQVVAFCVKSIIALLDSIRIQHRYDYYLEMLYQEFGLVMIAQ